MAKWNNCKICRTEHEDTIGDSICSKCRTCENCSLERDKSFHCIGCESHPEYQIVDSLPKIEREKLNSRISNLEKAVSDIRSKMIFHTTTPPTQTEDPKRSNPSHVEHTFTEYEELKWLLNRNGWNLECHLPLEIRHKEDPKSFASGDAARIVIDSLYMSNQICNRCGGVHNNSCPDPR